MRASLDSMAPSITTMIRMDHTHAVALFHRYKANTSTARKRALVRNACLALEVHAQLEEEIFYPALASVMGGDSALEKAKPEHDQMRRLIAQLRTSSPDDPAHDDTYMELMRDVLHHVADEETILLPAAERLLGDRVGELGMRMTKRRMQLLAPHAGEVMTTTARSFPAASALVAAGAVALGTLLVARRSNGARFQSQRYQRY